MCPSRSRVDPRPAGQADRLQGRSESRRLGRRGGGQSRGGAAINEAHVTARLHHPKQELARHRQEADPRDVLVDLREVAKHFVVLFVRRAHAPQGLLGLGAEGVLLHEGHGQEPQELEVEVVDVDVALASAAFACEGSDSKV